MRSVTAPLSDAQIQEYLARTFAEARKAVSQLEQDELWTVAAGSSLAGDDRKTDPYHVSHIVRSLLGSAVDHLHASANLVEGARVLHPMASFSLVRGALETAGTAIWVLSPSTRQERITRRFRLAMTDAMDGYDTSDETGTPRTQTRDEMRARILSLAGGQGIDPAAIKRATSTEAMKSAEGAMRAAQGRAPRVLTAWRICSGFAHGRSWALLSVLDREEIARDDTAGVGLFKVTNNDSAFAWVLGAALDASRFAGALYEGRATTHHA